MALLLCKMISGQIMILKMKFKCGFSSGKCSFCYCNTQIYLFKISGWNIWDSLTSNTSFVEFMKFSQGSLKGFQRTESEGPGGGHAPANGEDTVDTENRQGSSMISTCKDSWVDPCHHRWRAGEFTLAPVWPSLPGGGGGFIYLIMVPDFLRLHETDQLVVLVYCIVLSNSNIHMAIIPDWELQLFTVYGPSQASLSLSSTECLLHAPLR